MFRLLDYVKSDNFWNPPEDMEKDLTERKPFRRIKWFCAPVMVGMVLFRAWAVTLPGAGLLEVVLIILAVGINSGVMGINVGHERFTLSRAKTLAGDLEMIILLREDTKRRRGGYTLAFLGGLSKSADESLSGGGRNLLYIPAG